MGAYIGNQPAIGLYSKLDDISSQFNGTDTVFITKVSTVGVNCGSATNVIISVNGVLQEPVGAYSISASSIIFTTPPPTGATFFGVILGSVLVNGTVSDSSIGTSKLVDGVVNTIKLADSAVTNVKIGETISVSKGGTGVTTLTGLVKGNGSGAMAAAVAGTDYVAPGTATTFTAQQTFKEVKDTVFTITDAAAFEIDPANGSIQVVTLGASRTPAATNFEAGQVVLLGIDDGTTYSITWTTVAPTWVKAGGTASAPTLATSGYTWILLWKVGSTIYATEVGKP